MEQQLHELLARVEDAYGQPLLAPEDGYRAEPAEEERLSSADQLRVGQLFDQAAKDRAKAFELKKELDRLGAFRNTRTDSWTCSRSPNRAACEQ